MSIVKSIDIVCCILPRFSDIASDRQAWANGNVETMPRSPIEMDSVGELKTVPADMVGANTEEILASLGYSSEQIKNLSDKGSVL